MSSLVFATQTKLPSEITPVGALPTAMVARTSPVLASILDTVASAELVTHTLVPSEEIDEGAPPTAMVRIAEPVRASSWVTELSQMLATHTETPSEETVDRVSTLGYCQYWPFQSVRNAGGPTRTLRMNCPVFASICATRYSRNWYWNASGYARFQVRARRMWNVPVTQTLRPSDAMPLGFQGT
ncbi:unannotated protein [freshwater metagenome]|uniref:Unannotated protein n=1 Tax=freshwater metagenome TaxID=449393 RepID=A0A6J5YB91_9ZZZZ